MRFLIGDDEFVLFRSREGREEGAFDARCEHFEEGLEGRKCTFEYRRGIIVVIIFLLIERKFGRINFILLREV